MFKIYGNTSIEILNNTHTKVGKKLRVLIQVTTR